MAMTFKDGIPPKEQLRQYVIKMRNHPACVGLWNNCENAFLIANVQCTEHNGETYDCYYDAEWIDEKDIEGWCELP